MIGYAGPYLSKCEKVLADGGYTDDNFANAVKKLIGADVEVVKRNELHTFAVLPKRWIVDLKKQYDAIVSWAQMYDESSFEAKKMIAAALIKSVKIYNGNRMEFDFNLGVEQFLSDDEIAIRFDYGKDSTAKGDKKENWLAVV